MPFRITSIQNDPTWRTTQFNFLLSCSMLITDGLHMIQQQKSKYVTKLCSTFYTTFWVTATLQCIGYPMKFPMCNNGTTMQLHRPHWADTKGKVTTFLGIVAMNKTRACSYESNLKCQSNEWKHPSSPHPKKKCPTQCSLWHITLVGVILHYAILPRQMENAGYYCMFLQQHLCPYSEENNDTWGYRTPIILNDNAKSHIAAAVTVLFCCYGVVNMEHQRRWMH